MRVLVVDDSELVRSRLLEMLTDLKGVTGEAVGSLAEAWRAIRSNQPDVVVLDVRLPEGSGLDLLRGLRATGYPVVVIMLTGESSSRLRLTSLRAGADYFFDKTTEFQLVVDVVERLARTDAVAR